MHLTSYEHMTDLVTRYLAGSQEKKLRILDIGSYDVNGSYRPLFERTNWDYQGVDVTPGPNVDIVLSSPYYWNLETGSADVIISGQAFEHIEFFWLTWLEMIRILMPMPMSKHHPRNRSAQPGMSPQAARTVQHATQYGQRTRLAGTRSSADAH